MEDSSPALQGFAEDLQQEYVRRLQAMRAEIGPIAGAHAILQTLLERYCFIYVALREMEKDWARVDLQRYNQLTGMWIKVASDLLTKYRELYAKGATNTLFVQKVMGIVAEEVTDPEVLKRLRSRFANLAKAEG